MLMGRRTRHIVVTGRTTERAKLRRVFKDSEASICFLPTIQVLPKELGMKESALLSQLSDYDYIFFTSVNSVTLFARNLQTHQKRMQRDIAKIVAVGPATADACRKLRWKVAYMPLKFTSLAMTQTVKDFKGKNILFPRSAIAPLGIVTKMRRQGAHVTVIPLYTTSSILHTTQSLEIIFRKTAVDCITFMSSSSVQSLSRSLSDSSLRTEVLSISAVCIGPKTAYTAKRMGFHHIVTAETATLQGMALTVEHMLRT
jgi:uroporphyrinogen III methyltransferase/synthase